jgi:tRNA dimethylallyltransferase
MRPILLTGPTASGNSDVAIELALRIGGEIISVDSMQVYRGLDIGTAKPSGDERGRVPHHLMDVVGLDESFDAARFVQLANAAIQDIEGRGRTAILCGGTGLYFNAWLGGLGSAPPPDPALRAQLEAATTAELLEELARKDPVTLDQIDIQNRRRLVRAVEVIRITGKPFSLQRAKWPEQGGLATAGRAFGIQRDRQDLVRRIHERVERMFAAGLVAETQERLQQGLRENRTAMQAIGYRQVVEHLEGLMSLRATLERVQIKTRQYAKRQMTWMQGQLDLAWLEIGSKETPSETADRILRQWEATPTTSDQTASPNG